MRSCWAQRRWAAGQNRPCPRPRPDPCCGIGWPAARDSFEGRFRLALGRFELRSLGLAGWLGLGWALPSVVLLVTGLPVLLGLVLPATTPSLGVSAPGLEAPVAVLFPSWAGRRPRGECWGSPWGRLVVGTGSADAALQNSADRNDRRSCGASFAGSTSDDGRFTRLFSKVSSVSLWMDTRASPRAVSCATWVRMLWGPVPSGGAAASHWCCGSFRRSDSCSSGGASWPSGSWG